MKKNGQRVGAVLLCMALLLCGCGTGGEDTATATTTATPTTTRTTGTPTTIYAAAEPDLMVSSPTGERPNAELLERLAAICKAHRGTISLYYKDLENGYTIEYDADKTYQAASVIKAPYVKYLLSSGVDGSEMLTLKSKMGGSTYIDEYPVGTQFTVEELMGYAIRYSDNSAYNMLNQRFGFDGFNEYAEGLGITCNEKNGLTLQLPKPRFGYLSARDIGLYFEDIANYIETGTTEAKLLFSWLTTTLEHSQLPDAYDQTTPVTDDSSTADNGEMVETGENIEAAYDARFEGYTVGHKYGEQDYGEAWNRAYHDGAIVWRNHPYVLAVATNLVPHEDDSNQVFHDIASLIDQIQTDFYTY